MSITELVADSVWSFIAPGEIGDQRLTEFLVKRIIMLHNHVSV